MDPIRTSIGAMTLGFVLVTHLIGFNNVRVLKTFWIPEFVLILYAIYTLIPFELLFRLVGKLKTNVQEKRKSEKVVRFPSGKWHKWSPLFRRVSLPVLLDGLLIAAVVCLSFYLLYRI